MRLPRGLRGRLSPPASRGVSRPRPLRPHLLQRGADERRRDTADQRRARLVYRGRGLHPGHERRDRDREGAGDDLPGRAAPGEGGDGRGGHGRGAGGRRRPLPPERRRRPLRPRRRGCPEAGPGDRRAPDRPEGDALGRPGARGAAGRPQGARRGSFPGTRARPTTFGRSSRAWWTAADSTSSRPSTGRPS